MRRVLKLRVTIGLMMALQEVLAAMKGPYGNLALLIRALKP